MKAMLLEALIDSAKMLPFLFVVYVVIEWLEFKFGSRLRSKVAHARRYGPAVGALIGCFPQCGFSVVGASLYTRRLITIGTMIAIFLATSDEAIPVILAQPSRLGVLLPLLTVKFALAVVVGYALDLLVFRHQTLAAHWHEHDATADAECEAICVDDAGCCGHHVAEGKDRMELLLHPLKHTLSVFLFLVVVSFAISALIASVGEARLGGLLLAHSALQPVACALVGLIPNCAASVAITQFYLAGALSFGSVIAGLSASGGLGILVLFRDNRNIADTLKVVGLLFGISAAAGMVIQHFWG